MSYHIQHIPVYHKISTGCKLHNSDSDVLGEIMVLQKNLLFKVIFSVNDRTSEDESKNSISSSLN